jgi:shikimate 5-dehydrogenase
VASTWSTSRETPFAAEGERLPDDRRVEMLVTQAVRQFEAWTRQPAPVAAMTEAAVAAVAEARA